MSRRRTSRKSRKSSPPSAAPGSRAPELGKASRALLGEDSEARAVRRPPPDASVEDPLRDWPED